MRFKIWLEVEGFDDETGDYVDAIDSGVLPAPVNREFDSLDEAQDFMENAAVHLADWEMKRKGRLKPA